MYAPDSEQHQQILKLQQQVKSPSAGLTKIQADCKSKQDNVNRNLENIQKQQIKVNEYASNKWCGTKKWDGHKCI